MIFNYLILFMILLFSVHCTFISHISSFSYSRHVSSRFFGFLSIAVHPTFLAIAVDGTPPSSIRDTRSVKPPSRSDSFSTMCPNPCTCSPSLPPAILPGLWDIPPRRITTTLPPGRVPLAMSCAGQGLRSMPVPLLEASEPSNEIIVAMDLSDNLVVELQDSALTSYPHLKQLKLSGNNLQSIAPHAFLTPPLRVLLLDDNVLPSLPYDLNLTALEELSLEKNLFESIPRAVNRILSLKALNLARNRLTRLEAGDLLHLPNLVTLSLSRNRITEVHPQVFAALPSLENLDLASNLLVEVPAALQLCPSITHLILADNRIESLSEDAFSGLRNLQSVALHGNPIRNVHPSAFSALPSLISIILQEVTQLEQFPDLSGSSSLETIRIDRSSLTHVPPNLCSLVPYLKSLNLHRNLLASLPELALCVELRLLDLSHNRINSLGENQFLGQKNLQDLLLQQNRITVLQDGAFNGLLHLQTLNLEFNQIAAIGPKAFLPLQQLKDINLGNNDLSMFPEEGLEHVVTLKVHHNRHLRVFPGPERFHAAHTLVLSYAYHCCPYLRDDDYGMATEEPPRYIEDVIYNVEDIQDFDNSLLLNMSDFWSDKGKDDTLDKPASDAALKTREQQLSANLKRSSAAAQTEPPLATDADFVSDGMAEDFGTIWSKLAKDFTPRVVKDLLPDSGPSISSTDRPFYPRAPVLCIPKPGPFMPCRDLFDWWTLRCGVWIVFLLALLGNGTVVVVLCFARSKIDVPRFLVANLALADFFMGIYLGFLAVVDASTLGEFRMYAIPWQMSTGCQVAGFIGVFSSELSVFTLTVITLERNYAITHAMHLNKRLSLRHAAYVMLGGWVFAGTMAALPLVGISDYRKFAVCLPFETGGAGLMYVVILMFINGSAFVILMMCYLKIYCSIRGSQAWNSNDSRIAKRMALLVFTDFICLAPIAFFSLTAAFGLHLITLEEAKVFTVFVLPFNSCCNPFLYALLTKQFKKDCVTLCKTIEESRVTRGIGRCRHSSNFSNRQTPAHTNSALESVKSNGDDCNCQAKKQPPANFSQRLRISILKFFYCHKRRSKRNMNNEFSNEQNKIGNNNFRNTSMSSDACSSPYSDNWKRGRMPLSLRLLDRRRNSSWYLTRKPSQESNLSSSRNDSSATTASTSTWRISRSSVSSDISSGASRVLGKNDSQMSLKIGSFRERRGESRSGLNPTVMVLQHTPKNGNSFKRTSKPKLHRQTALEKESYLSNNQTCDPNADNHSVLRDNLSCVYEQDSLEEEDMTQVTAFLAPTYRIAGLAVGFIPRKLSTISSHSMSVTKELETEASPEDTPPEDRLFMSVAATEDIDKDRALIAEAIKKTDYRFHTTPKEKLRSRYYKSRRYPSDGNIRKRCDSPCPLHGGKDYIRRVATMPVILADVEPSPLFDVSPPSEEEYDVFIDTAVPQGLLETHFPLEEPPTEGDPLL
ncbi:leucine-rich repeat-containing G-protein coupled receptor 5A-like isoform X2 [Hyalella azteca]|uniref:Leucine-rich repeat-containing G-protein coupled receptor 5A-like isoform X2 n=1 Tax=Hyalella azteca TaxID=294128 RepID=A0A8B7PNV1_HYAAZ|nr:leucine-rich repeat-containing G-protein coupled receptor 5A-like isoform X2 [Hyalella azteca]